MVIQTTTKATPAIEKRVANAKAEKAKIAKVRKGVLNPTKSGAVELHVKPGTEVTIADAPNKGGRPRSGKEVITLRLDPDVIKALRDFGDGWQPEFNRKLRGWLKL